MSLTPQQQQFLATAAAQAVAAENATGCPSALTVAQAIFESGWGERTSGSNNFFGIKQYTGCPASELVSTTEWFTDAERDAFLALGGGRTAVLATPVEEAGNRRKYACQDLFAAYPTAEACFAYHGGLLQKGPYLTAWEQFQGNSDVDAYVRGIAVHYATAPNYADSILEMVHDQRVADAIAAARAQSQVT
jgi:flagellum-specific peptidoglycan hydrolase FlgJ